MFFMAFSCKTSAKQDLLRIIIMFCSKTRERGEVHSARKHFLGAFLADTSAF